MSEDKDELELKRAELNLKKIEFFAKLIGIVVIIGTLFLGVYRVIQDRKTASEQLEADRIKASEQLREDRAKAQEQHEQDFKLKLYDKQIQLYQKWVGIAAKITFSKNFINRNNDLKLAEFESLFRGELSVLKDNTIVRAGNNFVIQFKNARQKEIDLEKTKKENPTEEKLQFAKKQYRSEREKLTDSLHNLGQACRKSLSCSVGLNLRPHEPVKNKTYKCGVCEEWEKKIKKDFDPNYSGGIYSPIAPKQ